MVNKPHFEINIETFVLEGFSRNDAAKIKIALERELTFLINHQGAAATWTAEIKLPQIELGTLNISVGQDSTQIGRRIASSIFKQIQHRSTPQDVGVNKPDLNARQGPSALQS